MRRLPRLAVFVCTIGILVLAACDLRTSRTATDGKLEVASTVSPITNLVDNVGGDRIALTGLVPEGVNSHTYEPAPTDARVLGRARLFFANGLHLEEPLMKLAEANLDDEAAIVKLGDSTVPEGERIFDLSFPREAGNPNPHVWTNPTYAKNFVEEIAERLSQADASNKSYFSRNADQLIARINELDAALREAGSTIPRERRKLLTYHDSFPYFAREYGWKVIGAIQPSDFSEPSPRDVAQLIDQIRSEDVTAIFGSEVFPSAVLEQISKETGATYVDDLRDDDLPGDPGDAEHSYLSLMRFDYVTIIEALGGDQRGLDTLDVTNLRATDARYR